VVAWFLAAALTPGLLPGQEPDHDPSGEELARLNAEWDRQYAAYQKALAGSPEVQPGMVVSDLGAGKGGLTLELARAVGPEGHVYANDIDPRAIDDLERLSRHHRLGNVSVIEGRQNDPMLPAGRVEAAFLLKVYHQLEDAVTFLRTTREQLAPGALLWIVDVDVNQDWGEGTGSVSDPERCQADAIAAGFEIVRLRRFPIVDWKLYELVVRKPTG
jgi:predicted methyltransferase